MRRSSCPLTPGRDGDSIGLLVVGKNPSRALDADYGTFHELVAGQFAGAVVNIRAFEDQRSRAEALAELDRAKTAFFTDVSHEFRAAHAAAGPIGDVLDDAGAPAAAVQEQLVVRMRNGRACCGWSTTCSTSPDRGGRASPVRVETDLAALTAELAGIFRAATEGGSGSPSTVRRSPRRPTWTRGCGRRSSSTCSPTRSSTRSSAGSTCGLRGEDDAIVLTVADTGVGIVADELPLLFQPVPSGHRATARTREGTGIGLALVHELAALHGGAGVGGERAGHGQHLHRGGALRDRRTSRAARTGRSPVGQRPASEAASWGTTPHGPGETAGRQARPARPRVLVVDDNADMRAYLTRLLAPHWTVRTTANGGEALQAVAELRRTSC